MRRLAAVALVVAGSVACAAPAAPPDVDDHALRAARFRRQADDAVAGLAAWEPWLATLAERDAVAWCRDGDDATCFSANKERPLWDGELMEPLAVPGAALASSGPVPTIVDFARQLARRGIDLLVVPIPPRTAVYPELYDASAPLAPGATPPLLDFRLRRLYAVLEDHGVEVVDLLPALLAHRWGPPGSSPPLLVFRRQDPHWTPWGTRVAAAVVAARARRFPWWDEAARTMGEARILRRAVRRRATGAIVRELELFGPLHPGELGPETWTGWRVRVAGERWSHDDAGSPVLLLGDSFTMPVHGLPDELLAALGFRVDRVSVAGGLPSTALEALRLRGDASAGHGLDGKRLVIWQMATHPLQHAESWRPVDVDAVD